MNTDCITYYSKKGCPPCDFWYKILKKKYKGCYKKVTAKSEKEALSIVKSFNRRTVPFITDSSGKALTDKEFDKFMKTVFKST